MSKYARMYADKEFIKKCKVLAAENGTNVIDLTRNMEISINDVKKKKNNGWFSL